MPVKNVRLASSMGEIFTALPAPAAVIRRFSTIIIKAAPSIRGSRNQPVRLSM